MADTSLDTTGSPLGNLASSVYEPILGAILGSGPWPALFNQDESDFKQYSTTQTDRRQWDMIPPDSSTPSYYFILKYRGTSIQVPFNLNPQRETVVEPHASTVTYTQGGGKIVQSEGAITKDITISGTCGLYPNQAGRSPLPTSGVGSGLEGFKFLQNVFRRYCFLKRFGDLTQGLQLIYVNRRRQESWVVNPTSFTSEDATEHNNYWTYNIVLETLYPYDGADAKGLIENLMASVPGWSTITNVAQRVAETVDAVNASAGQISSIVNSFTTAVLAPLVQLSNSLADVVAGRLTNLTNFSRNSLQGLNYSLGNIESALEAAGLLTQAHQIAQVQRAINFTLIQDPLFSATPQTQIQSVSQAQLNQAVSFTDGLGNAVSPSDAVAAGIPTGRPAASAQYGGTAIAPAALPGSATNQANLQAKLNSQGFVTSATIGGALINPTIDPLTGLPKLTVSRFSENADEILTAIPPETDDISGQVNWYATWDQSIANVDPSNSDYRTTVVNTGDDIQSVALRVLGDGGRWVELVLLNNLKYPYVADPTFIFNYSTVASYAIIGSTRLTVANASMFYPTGGTVNIGSQGSANYERWTYQSISGNTLISSFPMVNSHSKSESVTDIVPNVTNVIAYGQSMKYPIPKQTAPIATNVWRNETSESLALSAFERALGSDIFIDPTTGDGVWVSNDLEIAYGVVNLQQFMRFCIVTKRGTYRRSPRLGFSQIVGSSVVQQALIQAEAQSIFLDDDRILSTQALVVNQVNGTLQIGIVAYVRNQQDPVTTPAYNI